MATNLNINEQLLAQALRVGGRKTKRETVNEALEEYISRRKRKEIVQLFGKLHLEQGYDYKALRRKR